jgi:integrase
MATIEKRVTEAGGVSYRVKVRMKGARTQTATFERLTDARKWAGDQESDIRNGRHFKTAEAKRHTVGDMIDRYIADVLPTKPRSEAKQRAQLLRWKDLIGHYTLADATPALIAECRDKLAREAIASATKDKDAPARSPSTVIRYLAALSHAFTIAVKEWGWVDDNPLRKVTKPKEPRGRVRYLRDDERERLLAECKRSDNPALYPAVVLALSTGARRMELMTLKWAKIDFNRRVIVLHETKNGERRSLPLVGHALDVLRERAKVRRIDSELVFPGNNPRVPVDLRASFESALKRAGVTDFRWHDLRHSCASYLAMNGASLAEIAEVLGHKTLQMVKRYAHLSEAHTSRVVERMAERIFHA